MLVAALALTGCGKDSDGDPASAASSTSDATPSAGASTPAAPTPKPTRTPVRPTATPTEGSGDAEGDDEPAAAGGGICVDLSEDEVGAALGGPVTGAAIPNGGCAFTQSRPRLPATNFIELSFSQVEGGMDGAKTNATSSVEGDPEDLTGVGEAAFVVTGTSFGGTAIQGSGAVKIGDRLITVELAQSNGLNRAKVRALVVSLLKLAVAEAA